MLFPVQKGESRDSVRRRRVEALLEEATSLEQSDEDGYLLVLAALRLAAERWDLQLPPYLGAEIESRRDELEPFSDAASELVERIALA